MTRKVEAMQRARSRGGQGLSGIRRVRARKRRVSRRRAPMGKVRRAMNFFRRNNFGSRRLDLKE